NNLVFSAIPNPTPTDYSLYFLPGTENPVTNLPSTMTASEASAQHTFTIPSTAPSRTGYNFTGYIDEDAEPGEKGSSTNPYQPGDTITILGDESYVGEATLTAQWSIASYTISISNSNTSTTPASSVSIPYGGSVQVTVTPSTGYYLSSVSCPSGYTCSGYGTGTSYTGQQTVTVTNNSTTSGGTLSFTGGILETRTLADISNMQDINSTICANTATNYGKSLTDSRDSKSYTVKKLADGKCWMTQNLRLVGTRWLSNTDSNVPSANYYQLPASSTNGWCINDTEACHNTANVLDSGNASYGVYYSWRAATAGSGTYSTTTSASYSICPKGWRLPTGGSSGEFQALYNKYSSTSAMMSADGPAFVLSGFRSGSSTHDQGSNGTYWSSTAYVSSGAYVLFLDSSNVYSAGGSLKYAGFTVRCVAE
ncbi:hypothetical protein IKW75_03585, partial [Candidatus Saccharibacteria bacterium]|nr:hypothetical protein [Candidatus Saccharibacteria bacterium]